MNLTAIPIGKLRRRQDARPLHEATIAALVTSIGEIGLISPIYARETAIVESGRDAVGYEVVAGNHRFEAMCRLGRDEVPAIIVGTDDLHAELAMIDENLMRADLSAADRARQTARRKAIYEELHPETRNGENQHTRDRKLCEPSERFSAETAKATGRSERVVQLDAERGNRVVADVLEKVRGTHLDTGAYLDRLKKETPERQRAMAEAALKKGPTPKAPRQTKVVDIPDEKGWAEVEEEQKRRIMQVWNSCSPAVRSWFLDEVAAAPIMSEAWS